MWKKKEQQQQEDDEESLTTAPASAAVDPPDSSLELDESTSYPDIGTWEMMQRLTLGFVHSDGGCGGGRQFLENVSLSSCTWSDGVCLIPI